MRGRSLGRGEVLRLLLLQTRRVRAVMKASERGEASSRRFGRRRRAGRNGGSMSMGMRVEGATSRAGTKDRRKIDRRRMLRGACHGCSAVSQ